MPYLEEPILEEYVRPEWVDYNGHMNDTAYVGVFSTAVDLLIDQLGMDETFRQQHHYSVYTLENHMCYLAEAQEGQLLQVTVQLLDHDTKRLHVFLEMKDKDGKQLATSEQMLMGIDMNSGRPAFFPPSIQVQVENLGREHQQKPLPKQVGRKIGIRR